MKMVCKECGASLILMFDCQSGTAIDENTGEYDLTKAKPATTRRNFHVQCKAGHFPVGYYYEPKTGIIREELPRLKGKERNEKTNRRRVKNNP